MKTAVTLPMDAATTTFFRSVLGTVNQVLASYDPAQLEEPWKSHYLQIKSDYDSALKDLPPTDQAPLALNASNHLQCLYSMLSNTSAMCSYLKSTMASMKPSAEVLASAVETGVAQRVAAGDLIPKTELDSRIQAGVEAEIARRTATGDLIAKETHAQLCSVAKQGGVKEGREGAIAEFQAERERSQTIATRKEALQTASLPGVTADVEALILKALGGSEEEFNAFKATAKARLDKFTAAGVVYNSQNPVFAKIYLPEEQFKVFEGLFLDPAIVGGGHEPFAKGPSAGSQPTGAMLV